MNHHQKIVKDTPRFLIINPNTNNTVTDNIREVVHSISPPGVMTEVTSPPHGPYAIETEQDKAAATQQVLALIQRRNAEGFSGYIMACFDDIAIAEARILTQVPVISLAEAAIRHAAATGGQFHEAIQEAIRLNLTPIVLGSGAFAGRAKALRRRYNIDIVDGFIEALDYTLLQAQVVKN